MPPKKTKKQSNIEYADPPSDEDSSVNVESVDSSDDSSAEIIAPTKRMPPALPKLPSTMPKNQVDAPTNDVDPRPLVTRELMMTRNQFVHNCAREFCHGTFVFIMVQMYKSMDVANVRVTRNEHGKRIIKIEWDTSLSSGKKFREIVLLNR